MAGLIDKDAELARLDKEITRLQGEVKRIGGKLANEGFVAKAPAAVIDKDRAKLEEAEKALTQLSEQRAHIANLERTGSNAPVEPVTRKQKPEQGLLPAHKEIR